MGRQVMKDTVEHFKLVARMAVNARSSFGMQINHIDLKSQINADLDNENHTKVS